MPAQRTGYRSISYLLPVSAAAKERAASCCDPRDEGIKKGKDSLYSIPELIPVLGSQPAGDVNHKPGGRLPLLSTRPAITLATSFAAW